MAEQVQVGGLITVAETAKLLGRSTEQVRRYLREGELPGRRLGGQWFIDRVDAEVFLLRRRDGSEFERRLADSDPDPLRDVIAIGGSGGGDIAAGRSHYLRSLAGESTE
jgi:excisionase family DNA binding protein